MNDDEMEAQMEYWKSKAKAAVAERDEARRELDFKKKALRNCREAHLAAEAECKSLAAERRETVAEWEREGLRMSAENRRLREALTERGMTESWRPEWTSPPGDTLRELIEMRGWTQAHLAREIGWSLKHVNRVVQGHETISVDFAMALESLDFGSAEFWMRREGDYRVGVARAALREDA